MSETLETPACREARLRELISRAQAGDRSVLPDLRQALAADSSLWTLYGDLAAQAQASWLNMLAGRDLYLYEAVRHKLEELRAELAGPNPSPLERLLVERIVACWLQLHYADALFAQASPQATSAVRQELMRRQESAQRRYLAGIKQLALVRKLLAPRPSALDIVMGGTAAATSARGRGGLKHRVAPLAARG